MFDCSGHDPVHAYFSNEDKSLGRREEKQSLPLKTFSAVPSKIKTLALGEVSHLEYVRLPKD